jgi:hypothetical protein
MTYNRRLSLARVATAVSVIACTGVFAASASAASVGESVSGTTLSELSLTAGTGAVLATNFSPGNTASSTGLLTATDTNSSWTLQVKDTASSNAGKMKAAAVGCTGSDAALANPLSVNVTSPLGGVTSAGSVSISGSNQTVASASAQPLAANLLTTNYSQTIPSSEVMLTGCVYSLTATYTLQ